MRRLMFTWILPLACGCAPEAALEAERFASSPHVAPAGDGSSSSTLHSNGIIPNGIIPHGIIPSALRPDSLPSSALRSLRDEGPAGTRSRAFVKYAVGCAFDASQTFTLRWSGGTEEYRGALGLAPEWAEGPLSPTKQRWVSACIAARANRLGLPVTISMRSPASAGLVADLEERRAFSYKEGAFWGNLFGERPALYACHVPSNAERVRAKDRSCATGLATASGPLGCGIIQPLGDCASLCTAADDPETGYTSCGGSSEVITTFVD